MVEMNYVDSSNIEAIGYGTIYVYHGVPSEVYENLMSAPSKGSFLNREIKGIYEFTQQ